MFAQIIPYDGIRTIPKLPSEGQARAKFNFIAQTHLELSLVKGEMRLSNNNQVHVEVWLCVHFGKNVVSLILACPHCNNIL